MICGEMLAALKRLIITHSVQFCSVSSTGQTHSVCSCCRALSKLLGFPHNTVHICSQYRQPLYTQLFGIFPAVMTTFPRRSSHVSLTSVELFMRQKLNTCRIVFARTELKYLCVEKKTLFAGPLFLYYRIHTSQHVPVSFFYLAKVKTCGRNYFTLQLQETVKDSIFFFLKYIIFTEGTIAFSHL